MDSEDYIVVGSSHAYRICSALNSLGESVHCLASSFFRLNAEKMKSTLPPRSRRQGWEFAHSLIAHLLIRSFAHLLILFKSNERL